MGYGHDSFGTNGLSLATTRGVGPHESGQMAPSRKEVDMGFLSDLERFLGSLGKKTEAVQPLMVVQYGSTKSYTFRREVLRGNFPLPELADQANWVSVLRAARQFLLPDLTDEDFDGLREMLTFTDDVILGGLKDPGNWVLPQGFSDIPWVKSRLGKHYPIEQIIEYILDATRLYIWLYRDDEAVNELIPHLLELEESFEPLRTRRDPGDPSSNRRSRTVDADH